MNKQLCYLRVCNTTSIGYKVWQQIPGEIQEVLKPHFNSRLVHAYNTSFICMLIK